MAVKWRDVFTQEHPRVKMEVSAGGAGKGVTDALSGIVEIGMVSRAILPAEIEKGGLGIPVVKDAVVAVVNDQNPVLDQLVGRGMTRDTLTRIWIKGDVKTWGEALGTKASEKIQVYTRSDACGAAETWAQYLGATQEDLKGVGVYGDPGIAERVARNRLSIGYNNLNFAYDPRTRRPLTGIRLVPLDTNGNGRIEESEAFYDTKDALLKAIADGHYPSPPARDLNFLTKGKPEGAVREFIVWVLTDGQKYADEVGYVPLPESERQAILKTLE